MAWFRSTRWGVRLAGVWFVAYGMGYFASASIPQYPLLLAILAIAAGVLILLDR